MGDDVSHAKVGQWAHDAHEQVIKWINRPIPSDIAYVVLDGMYVSVKRQTARDEPVLAAIGIAQDGRREVLDVMPAPSESFAAWSTLLARLRGRALSPQQLKLVITDGDQGVTKAVAQERPDAPRQRCCVHKVRNVVGTSPPSLKGVAPKEASAIWKAPNKAEARVCAKAFVDKYRPTHAKLADIIEDDFEATLAFYDLDSNVWTSLRSTNIIKVAASAATREML